MKGSDCSSDNVGVFIVVSLFPAVDKNVSALDQEGKDGEPERATVT